MLRMMETEREVCLIVKDRKQAESLLYERFNDLSKSPEPQDIKRLIEVCSGLPNSENSFSALGQ